MTSRQLIGRGGVAAAATLLALVCTGAPRTQAQDYPSRPITLVVGLPPGGPTDSVARILAERMKATLGESLVVENQAGAAGTIAAARVAHATPDGYTLSVGQWTTNVGAAAVFPLQFDVLADFTPIALLTSSRLWLVARKDLPANTAGELVAWLKANPGKATAASVGAGSAAHVCLLDVQNRSGIRFPLVAYRGGPPAMQDLISGQVDFSCLEAGQTLPQYRVGNLKVLGLASETRWAGAPEVPTLAEGGLPGVAIEFWHGLWAPKGTPPAIIAKLNAAVAEAFADVAVRERFTRLGHTVPPREKLSPEALYAHHKAEIDKWWPVIKAE